MGTSAWFHAFDAACNRSFEALFASLSDRGVNIDRWPQFEEEEPGILAFDRLSSGLLDFLRNDARRTTPRILALGCAPCLAATEVWQLLEAGASDFLNSQADEFDGRAIAARLERWPLIDETVKSERIAGSLIGTSQAWMSAVQQVVEASLFSTAPILLIGESGTGKELMARLVHDLDRQKRARDFVLLDCSTIVPELSGSEFFGHERGAFTGALSQRDGAFAQANGGTLFLDEVGELPPLCRRSFFGPFKNARTSVSAATRGSRPTSG